MLVELTNHLIEMSKRYEVERIEESKYGCYAEFSFYFGNGKWSKTYNEPTYSYNIIRK